MNEPTATKVQPIGKVAAPPNKESTSDYFYFWVAKGQLVERTQLVRTSSTLGKKTVEFIGIVDEVYRQSRQHDMGEEIDRHDANPNEIPPFASAGFTYAKVTILRTDPVTYAPPLEESLVWLGDAPEAAKGYGIDRMPEENRLHLGRLRNGGEEFAGTATIDLAYLLGENGGHLNVNGIAGMGTKSSLLLHVNDLLMRWAKRMNMPGDPQRTQIVPIIFNVKNFDLFWIDRWNRNWCDEHCDDWRALGIDDPQPFKNVQFYAPREAKTENPIRTGRDDVKAYSWGLADVIAQGTLRFLFAEDDIGNANFSALVGTLEERLTDDSKLPRQLREGVPNTFNALLEWLRDTEVKELETHSSTKASFIRRLHGLLLDCDGVLRRDQSTGHPLNMPGAELKGPLVIDLCGARDEKVRRFVVASVMHQLVSMRSGNATEGLRYIVTLDELNRFAPKSGSDPITELIERVAAEMRSQGIILLGAQQEASRVRQRVIENSAIRVVGRTGSAELTNDVWRFLGDAARKQASQLQQTEKLVLQPSFRAPMLAKIPFPPWALRKEEAATPPTTPSGRAQRSLTADEM